MHNTFRPATNFIHVHGQHGFRANIAPLYEHIEELIAPYNGFCWNAKLLGTLIKQMIDKSTYVIPLKG